MSKNLTPKKRVILFLTAFIMIFLLCGCATEDYKMLDTFENETDRKYTVVHGYYLLIDGKTYNYTDCARKLVKPDRNGGTYGDVTALENDVFFTYNYNTNRNRGDEYQYNTSYDVGLFMMNYVTGKCELIKKYEDINGFYYGSFRPWKILNEVLCDKYAVIDYNGVTEVIDIYSKTTLFSESTSNKSQELEDFLAENRTEIIDDDSSISFGGKVYDVDDYNDYSYTLTEKETQTEYVIDHDFFMDNSQTYKYILENWKRNTTTVYPFWIGTCNDRLIVGCKAKPSMFSGGNIPLMLFEVDLETSAVSYIGYLRGHSDIYKIVEL